MQTTVASMSLAEAAWPARENNKIVRSAVLLVAGVAFMTLCAKIQVPMWPVPMTMQTFGALVIGAAYGWPLGAVTVLGYLAAGFVGLPVFSGAAVLGPAYFLGATAGYLYGFVVAAGIVADWRRPNVLRLAPVPLYNRYRDVYDAVAALKRTLDA